MSNGPPLELRPSPPLLVTRGIHKRFPGVHALKGIDLEVRRGEVHVVVGENGAGKSTLMHILAGVYLPDAGSIEFDGRVVVLDDERAAQELGIAIVFQERSLFGPLSVAENVFAARQPVGRLGRIDRRRLHLETRQLLGEVGLDVDPATPLDELSSAQQQLVEIAKALSLRARLIIFDEPTAALSAPEAETLFGVIEQLRRQGVGIVYISHRLAEVFAIGDRVTVLKDGMGRGTFALAEVGPDDLISRMVGRELTTGRLRRDPVPAASPIVLEVRGLRDGRPPDGRRTRLMGIDLQVRAGEVVVLAGLVGAGRTELALSLFGARPGVVGEVLVEGRPVRPRSPTDAIAAGIGYLPEDRKEAGLFLAMGIAANIAVVALRRFGTWWLDDPEQASVASEICRRLRVACRGMDEPVRNLSGGSQQKVALAKWLLAGPKVLIVDEPTRGVDVGAKEEVHALLLDLARQGTAVVVISSDLPEVLTLADRVVVLREGEIAGELDGDEATEEEIMRYASLAGGGR